MKKPTPSDSCRTLFPPRVGDKLKEGEEREPSERRLRSRANTSAIPGRTQLQEQTLLKAGPEPCRYNFAAPRSSNISLAPELTVQTEQTGERAEKQSAQSSLLCPTL